MHIYLICYKNLTKTCFLYITFNVVNYLTYKNKKEHTRNDRVYNKNADS